MSGVVYLVGAGPGDPGLLTLRARDLLDSADVVAYDELLSDALLACVPPSAELVPVGRRAHGPRVDYALHPAVLERARAGQRVVRLKAGDPLVFGRGGEEAEALRAAGIDFEIVPGVSSALGAAAYAGIPLTHRGIAPSVTLTTGHEGLAATSPDGTIAMFMAGKRLPENLRRVIDGGRDPATPAAWIAAATTGRQRVVVGTLADLHERVDDSDAPALVIVGGVVALRERIAWIEQRPLFARRVVVGRARPGRSAIADRLRARGADVVEMPDVTAAQPATWMPFDRAMVELGGYAAVVFASDEAATYAFGRLGACGRDVRTLPATPIIAVGDKTARALRERGLVPSIETTGACADALRPHPRLHHGRLLLVADDGGRPQLAAELRALGASVEIVAAYRHVPRWIPARGHGADLVIAPSSTAALHLGEGPHGATLRACRWLVMGAHSEAAARSVGASDVVRAPHDDVDAIVRRAEELLA